MHQSKGIPRPCVPSGVAWIKEIGLVTQYQTR